MYSIFIYPLFLSGLFLLPVFCAESSAATTTTSVSENGAPFRCYTCLGRDFDNCQSGSVQCAGTCWKIIDQEHELIAKGCTAEQKEDGTEEQNLNTRVQLPWTKDLETIQVPLLGFSLMLSYLTGQFFANKCENAQDLHDRNCSDYEHFFWFGKGKSKADYALIADRFRMARMKRCTSGRNCHGRLEPELIVLPDADDSELDIDSDESVELLADGEEENFSSDEETPIEVSERRRKRTFNFKWKSQRFVNRDVPWTEEDSMDESDEQEKSPVDYFRYFMTKDAIRLITEYTNIYAAQKKSKFRTTETEVETFLGVLLKMGVVTLPQFRMYWSAYFRVDSIANSMSRNRFIELLRFLHFNDNEKAVLDRHHPSYDTFYKVRPLLNLFLQSCRGLKNEEKHSIGKSVIPFKGRCGIRQPLPSNAWLIYRKDVEEFSGSSEKPLNLLDFTISVASSLCHAEEASELVRRGPKSRLSTSPTADGTTRGTRILTRSLAADLRYDEISHWPLSSEKRMRCKLCSKIVQFSCSKCQVFLCLTQERNCFRSYHTR
ncbi:PiggyBac transposable element-derived protein [Trichinella spiralis]|uniref:PiggyBac transposable element-derived protein n=1 Tax=Trichinella spiralis TaxID=6334 RepID=A0ABR3L056_TRISP